MFIGKLIEIGRISPVRIASVDVSGQWADRLEGLTDSFKVMPYNRHLIRITECFYPGIVGRNQRPLPSPILQHYLTYLKHA